MTLSFTFASFICFYFLFAVIAIVRISKMRYEIISVPMFVGLVGLNAAFILSTVGFVYLLNGEPLAGFLGNVSMLCFMPIVTFICMSLAVFALILCCYLFCSTLSAYSRGEDEFIASIKSFRGKHIVNH